MADVTQMDLDHDPPLAVDPTSSTYRVRCRKCNRSDGGRSAHT